MTREEARKAAEVMKAYAEGKTVESNYKYGSTRDYYCPAINPDFNWESYDYRIKPEPKYRAFNDGEECTTEMLKHNAFGWVRYKKDKEVLYNIRALTSRYIVLRDNLLELDYPTMFNMYEFLDGTPFGIKENE